MGILRVRALPNPTPVDSMTLRFGARLPTGLAALALAVVMVTALPQKLTAQAPSPSDSAAVLLRTAQAFEASGRGEVAEALYAYIAEHFGATSAAAAARVALARWRAESPDRSGRVELQVWGTLYGVWLGLAVPTAFGAEDSEAYGAGILLGAPAGFLAARAITRARTLTEGQTRAITWGGTWGTFQGLGWSEVLDLGEDVFCVEEFCYEGGDQTEERFASMVAGGLAGLVVGGLLARRDIDAGVATGAHYGSLVGTWFGGLEEDDDVWASTLLVGNAGLVGGAWAADHFGWTRNRVRLIGLGTLLGGLAGVGLDLLVQPDDDEAIFGIPLATSVAGLATAVYLTRDYDASPGIDGGSPDALLSFNGGGGWSVGVPVPVPTLLRAPDVNGRDRLSPGLRFTLFNGRFQ